jgi:chromosome segregation ATPase
MRTIITLATVIFLTVPCLAVESAPQSNAKYSPVNTLSIVFADQELEKAKETIAALKAQLADRERLISMSLSASASEASAARSDAEKERAAKDKLKVELAGAKIVIEAERKRLSAVIADKNAALDKAIKEHEVLRKAVDTNNSTIIRLNGVIAGLKVSNELAVKEAAELRAAVEKEKNIASAASSRVRLDEDKVNAENASLKEVIVTHKAEIAKLRKEIDRLNSVLTAKNVALDKAIKVVLSKTKVPASVKVTGDEYDETALGRVTVNRSEGKIVVAVAADVEQKADTRFLGAVIEKKRSADKVVYVLDASKLANKGNN